MHRTLALLLIALVLAGCSGGGETTPSSAPSQTPTGTPSSPTGGSTASPSQVQPSPTEATIEPITAERFLAALEDSNLPVSEVIVFNRRTDPNGELGRPGQYIEKAAWNDSRVECYSEQPGWECGGDIEVFENQADRDRRFDYLSAFAQTPPFGGFYLWRIPNAILRVGFDLTPRQAREYQVFFTDFAGGDIERYSAAG